MRPVSGPSSWRLGSSTRWSVATGRSSSDLHPDVVYEVPQTRERISGRQRYVQFNREYLGTGTRRRVVLGDNRRAVVWFAWRAGDGPTTDGIAFFEVADGMITGITDFWPEPYEPLPGREHLTERY